MSEHASEGTEQMELPAAASMRMNASGSSPGNDQPPTVTANTDTAEQTLPSITKPKSNRSSTFNTDQQLSSHYTTAPTLTNRSATDNPRAPLNFGSSVRFPDYKCYPDDEASPGKHQMPESNKEGCI